MVEQKCKTQGEMNKEPIELPNNEVVEWGDDEANQINYETPGYGLQQVYDGSGYVRRVPYSTPRADYIKYIDSLFENSKFFDASLLSAFTAHIAFYIPSHDWLISINILIEFD